jgi:predicted ATPase
LNSPWRKYLSAARLAHPLSDSEELLEQTNVWLQEIIPNIKVIVSENRSLNAFEIRYQFTSTLAETTNEFKAENVGFGVSYVLPIIVIILSAKPDSLIMIENPEAHLHPKSQSKLAELMALAAQNGVQILIETHSDHIINGTLVAVKKYETEKSQGIAHDKVKIHYFLRSDSQHTTEVINLPVLESGKIKNPPAGFFDQIETDLETLIVYKEISTNRYWYLDNLHKDHYEVFNAMGEHIGVANLQGEIDTSKREKGRRITVN